MCFKVSSNKHCADNKIVLFCLKAISGIIFNEPFSIDDDIGLTEEERQPQQLATQPTLPTPSLATPSVNPALVSPAPTGITSLNQGLTPTESALLSPEEQQIRLRSRGLG